MHSLRRIKSSKLMTKTLQEGYIAFNVTFCQEKFLFWTIRTQANIRYPLSGISFLVTTVSWPLEGPLEIV